MKKIQDLDQLLEVLISADIHQPFLA